MSLREAKDLLNSCTREQEGRLVTWWKNGKEIAQGISGFNTDYVGITTYGGGPVGTRRAERDEDLQEFRGFPHPHRLPRGV